MAALAKSQRFTNGTEGYSLFVDYVGHLIKVATDATRLGLRSRVTLSDLYQVSSNYLSWLADNKDFLRQFDNPAEMATSFQQRSKKHSDMAELIRGLSLALTDEIDALTRSGSGLELNQRALQRYMEGNLTFGELLVISPESFLPH